MEQGVSGCFEMVVFLKEERENGGRDDGGRENGGKGRREKCFFITTSERSPVSRVDGAERIQAPAEPPVEIQ